MITQFSPILDIFKQTSILPFTPIWWTYKFYPKETQHFIQSGAYHKDDSLRLITDSFRGVHKSVTPDMIGSLKTIWIKNQLDKISQFPITRSSTLGKMSPSNRVNFIVNTFHLITPVNSMIGKFHNLQTLIELNNRKEHKDFFHFCFPFHISDEGFNYWRTIGDEISNEASPKKV